jgi:hypothetical protein
MATLVASPFNFIGGESIWVKVIATNIHGNSDYSEAGNGALYLTIPVKPINLLEDVS